MSIGLLGQKIGMTSVYDAKGRLCPVTVIAAGDNVLLRRLTEQNEGYSAVQVGFGTQKESRITKPLLGEFKKAGVGPRNLFVSFVSKAISPRARSLECYTISSGRLRGCDWPIQGKGFQGVMKSTIFMDRARRTVRRRTGAIGAVGNRSTRDGFGRTRECQVIWGMSA